MRYILDDLLHSSCTVRVVRATPLATEQHLYIINGRTFGSTIT
jgi:hypothetical protein